MENDGKISSICPTRKMKKKKKVQYLSAGSLVALCINQRCAQCKQRADVFNVCTAVRLNSSQTALCWIRRWKKHPKQGSKHDTPPNPSPYQIPSNLGGVLLIFHSGQTWDRGEQRVLKGLQKVEEQGLRKNDSGLITAITHSRHPVDLIPGAGNMRIIIYKKKSLIMRYW